ncbi:MAG: 3-hydroxyacyl-CoA dehydrogenase NAD-binding domain-containing protein [Thermaurantiacus sp.]|uniref:3-hydroxyacyl-CoA dehydrogenase n=1 Tax=Thermaurantiacus sp. TaxID=2820283 RepID=UPI00298EDB72|nr:3-hydroxyacyl-CoA dehydrogenase NAD-binding domain-containing protein [Thermaurantiacus sp.]MDW8415711.1 3-hydroxyacyl-CoA dehydrogenase NAD-binding domain-containing protein [Thermaurantiacus sp.]
MSEEALRHVEEAERAALEVDGVGPDTPVRPVARVGVVGAGTMGGGIAMNFLNIGVPVTIVERAQEPLDRGLAVVRRNYERSASRGRLTMDDVERRMALLTPSLALANLADCDLVIEAVFEDMALKKRVFAELDRVVKDGAILATNTSFLDVNEIAAATARPQDVLGMHFFSPANVMRLLEIVRGARTAPDVIKTAIETGRAIGKVPVVAGVCPGFIGNRMLARRQQAANELLLEGAMPWEVDRALTNFGFPMGPFQMADLAGLDIGWNPATSKGETLRDRLCEMGRRGQKTGAGFYDYDAERNRTPSPVVERLIRDFVREKGGEPRPHDEAEILDRLLQPMIEEGQKILAEGIAARPGDIDVVWVHGYGWPRATGGPMWWAGVRG